MTEQDTSSNAPEQGLSVPEKYKGYMQFMAEFFPVHVASLGERPDWKFIDEDQQRRLDEILQYEAITREMVEAVDVFLTSLSEPHRNFIRARYSLDEPERGSLTLKQLAKVTGYGNPEAARIRRAQTGNIVMNLLTVKQRNIYGFTVSTKTNG